MEAEAEVEAFLTMLATRRWVSAPAHNQALSGWKAFAFDLRVWHLIDTRPNCYIFDSCLRRFHKGYTSILSYVRSLACCSSAHISA